MTKRFQQFLGTNPGIIVELLNDDASPFRVRTEGGFEFSIRAEDFKSYYKEAGTETPPKWKHLITDPEEGTVRSEKMTMVMDAIRPFEEKLRDFDRARDLVRDILSGMKRSSSADPEEIRSRLAEKGWDPAVPSDAELKRLREIPDDVRDLLLGDTCAVIPFLDAGVGAPNDGDGSGGKAPGTEGGKSGSAPAKPRVKKKAASKVRKAGMTNVELSVDKSILTVVVDLSKDFGPSKSGKTIIVASTRGNKTVPGREEKIGLNIYRQETKKPAKGRRKSFKNVEMEVQGDVMTITIDLSKDFGPSKSGQTTIIASTEGNQLVFGREEKIGLNVYKKIEPA
jgi:hypothetical protein